MRIATWRGSSGRPLAGATRGRRPAPRPPSRTASSAFSPRFTSTCRSRSSSPATGGTGSRVALEPDVAPLGLRRRAGRGRGHERRHVDRASRQNSRGRANWRKSSRMWSSRRISSRTSVSGSSSGGCTSPAGAAGPAAPAPRAAARRRSAGCGSRARGRRSWCRPPRASRPSAPRRESSRFSTWSRTWRIACSTRDEQLLRGAGLHEVRAGAGPHRRDGRLERGEAGEEHHLAVGRPLLELRRERGPVAVGQAQIDERHVESVARARERLGAGPGAARTV